MAPAASGVATPLAIGRARSSRRIQRPLEASARIDPRDVPALVTGLTFVEAGAFTGTMTPIADAGPLLTALRPARVWMGLENSHDVGTRVDLVAEVHAGAELVASGQANGVSGGGSGFNSAMLTAIPLVLEAPVAMPPGTALSVRVGARITCSGKTHASGTVRLWTNDGQARSGFGVTIDAVSVGDFLRSGFALAEAPGAGPKVAIDKLLDSRVPCSAGRGFTPFGTWSVVLP